MGHRFTEREVNFIIKNYSNHGAQYCSELLNIHPVKIQKKANNLKLVVTQEARKGICRQNYYANHPSLNPNLCDELFSTLPDVWVYLLGFLWADGHLEKASNRINLKIQEKDGQHIINLINKFPILNFISYKLEKNKRDTWQKTLCFRFSDKNIYLKLLGFGYGNKSNEEPQILSIIPDDKKHLWLLGFFDGDGCLTGSNRNKNNSNYLDIHPNQIILAGSYASKWDVIFNLLENIGVKKIKVSKLINKKNNNKSSSLSIKQINDVILFINYIYKHFEFGLPRKYKIAQKTASFRTKTIINNHLIISPEKLEELRFQTVKQYDKKYFKSIEKPVSQIDLKNNTIIKRWSSAKEAAITLFKDENKKKYIQQACRNPNSKTLGFKWSYL